MNVTIRALAGELARAGISSDLYTRATSPDDPPVVEVEPGVRVLHLPAGRSRPSPSSTCPATCARFCARCCGPASATGPTTCSTATTGCRLGGPAGQGAGTARWPIPSTLGRVKNLSLADGDQPEPPTRLAGEERVVATADRLLTPPRPRPASWSSCTAPPRPRSASCPGVDRTRFHPGDRAAARAALGVAHRHVLAFVGRLQPLKAPDVAVPRLAALCHGSGPTWTSSCWWSGGRRATATTNRPAWPGWPPPTGSPTGSGSSPPSPRPPGLHLPGGRPGPHALLVGVVRPGRPRGPGLRHPGGRGRGRGPAARRRRRHHRGPAGQPPARGLGHGRGSCPAPDAWPPWAPPPPASPAPTAGTWPPPA